MEKEKNVSEKGQTGHKVLTVIGVLLCIILLPILAINITLIVKGTMNDKVPPSINGITPLVVLSGSMDDGKADAIKVGDLIFVKKCDATKLTNGQVIAFMEGSYAVTHRIVDVKTDDNGSVSYITQGDANNTQDGSYVTPENVLGVYEGNRVAKLGNFIIFLQTLPGMLIFVGLPILLFVIYDIARRQKQLKNERIKQDQLRQELEELKNSSPDPDSSENLENLDKVDVDEMFTIPLPQTSEPEEVLKEPTQKAKVVRKTKVKVKIK